MAEDRPEGSLVKAIGDTIHELGEGIVHTAKGIGEGVQHGTKVLFGQASEIPRSIETTTVELPSPPKSYAEAVKGKLQEAKQKTGESLSSAGDATKGLAERISDTTDHSK